MKLTDLSKNQLNQIVNRLPPANQVRLAAVSKELRRRVNRVQGPISPHPSHDTLREPDTHLIMHVAQRFTDLRDFLRVCAATGPIEAIEYGDEEVRSPYFVYSSNENDVKIGIFEARQKRREERYAWFIKLWETHSKIPSKDVHLSKLMDNELLIGREDILAGCKIRVNCGPTYYFVLEITWRQKDSLFLNDFTFLNHDGFLLLLYGLNHARPRLDADFEPFISHFFQGNMLIGVNLSPESEVRKCARLALVMNKVMILLYARPLGRLDITLHRREALKKILRHNGFDV